MLIRAPDATHVYTGIDLARLSGALKPSVVVTAADLAQAGTRVPEFYAGDLFCPVGKTPLYLGQPVALLIFETFDAFDQARLALRDGSFVKFGEETGPVMMPNYGAYRFTRVAGPTPDAPDVYSPLQAGWVSPRPFQNADGAAGLDAARRADRQRLRQSRDLWRADPRRACSEKSGHSGAGPRVRNPIHRSDVSRAGMRARLVRRRPQEPRARARRAVALRGRGGDRVPAGQGARAVQAGAHQRAVRLYGRRIRRTRPHAVPALCRAGGDVLSRPPGAARARPLSAVPERASSGTRSRCARGSASTARPARFRHSPPITCWMAAASPTFRPTWRPSAPPPRSASTTSRKSMSPRSRCIRAA